MPSENHQLTIDEQIIDYLNHVKQFTPNSYLKYSVGSMVLFEHKNPKNLLKN